MYHLKDISDKEKSVSTINSYLEEDEEVAIKTIDAADNSALSEDFVNKVDNLESLIALFNKIIDSFILTKCPKKL
jgi:hypothetical protein